MTPHRARVYAESHGWSGQRLRVRCSCGESLALVANATPGELWRIEQDHRIAMSVAGPTPTAHWPGH